MDIDSMADQARTVRQRFAEFEQRRYGRPWTPREVMLGFVGDVGDLAKLVQGKAGVRLSEDLDRKVAHELADCLWAVLTLADIYAVDLEAVEQQSGQPSGRTLDAWMILVRCRQPAPRRVARPAGEQ